MKELNFKEMEQKYRIALQIIKGVIETLENSLDTLEDSVDTLEDSIDTVDTAKPDISRGTGAPSGGSDKDLYIDDTGGTERLYVNVNGSWKYVGLT